jgi:small subunit ribosomal protein S1
MPREDPIVVTLPPVVMELGASFVGVVHNDGGRGGYVVLTRHPRRVRRSKPIVALAFKEQTPIKGLVTGAIKGGIEVDVDGLRAFAPASHVDLRHGGDLRYLIGKRLDFFVTQYGKRGRDVVLTRKTLLEAEAKQNRALALSKLVPGTIVEGVVRSIVPFGAFIDVGGVEGLVPLSEMSHNRADQPGDVFEQGSTIEVQVQRIDVKGKIWLSRKACLPDPWMEAVKKFAVGSAHKGKVARIQPFGVFVELEPGIDGLIHTSDLTMKPIKHPSEIVKVGEEIDVVVASTDAQGHRIALHPVVAGMEGETPQKVALHRTVKVVVVSIEQAGLVVRILGVTGRNGRGFITSAGTGTPRGTDLRKGFPVGSTHEAKIIEMDPRRGDVKLSIKAMHEDSERSAYKQYKQQVSREAKFGTFGDLLAKKLDKPS